MFKFLKQTATFLTGLARDPRIPPRDKALLAAMCAYLATPFDLIPDFIPVLGYADDAVVAALVLDYVFNVIPEDVVLDHFPWDHARYLKMRRRVRLVSRLIPGFIRRRLWKQVEAAQKIPE